MKIIAKNASVGQTSEDIISKGGTLTIPTEPRIHAIASDSTADDAGGTAQVETATAAGTIAGILQVETATIAGTIGAAGAGNVSVVVTGALVTGSPLTVPVAVANDDTAELVAGKVRTALGLLAAITTHYTVGGSGAEVSLTTKAVAANDATLNIASSTGTATGLTAAPTSVNTTSGHAGSGNATVVITSAILTGSPVTYNVPVTVGDNANAWAAKVRDYLGAQAALIDKYDVSGATNKIILTAKAGAANDATLNISLDNGTCNGITTAASSANTTAGIAGTGAHTVEITGITDKYLLESEIVILNGVDSVNTQNKYLWLKMQVKTAGSGGKNAGTITATAAVDSSVSCQIEAGQNVSEQAVIMVPKNLPMKFNWLSIGVANSTSGAVTTVTLFVKKDGEVWIPEFSIDLSAEYPIMRVIENPLLPILKPGTIAKFSAVASAGSSAVTIYFDLQ